jgi:hypothetical protein
MILSALYWQSATFISGVAQAIFIKPSFIVSLLKQEKGTAQNAAPLLFNNIIIDSKY